MHFEQGHSVVSSPSFPLLLSLSSRPFPGAVWEGAAVQRPLSDLRLPAGLLRGHHHGVFLHQRLLLQGQPGGGVRRPHLLRPLPAAPPLLRLEGRHGVPGQNRCGEWTYGTTVPSTTGA